MRASLIAIALPLLFACTSSKPLEDKPKSKTDVATTQAPTPEPASPDAAQPAPAQPALAGASNEWWCLCYQSEREGKQQGEGACRSLEKQCRALEKRIARGGRGIVAGSLSHSCRKLEGEHPGDAAGGRDAWKPSKLAGAWTSEGACLLTGAPDVVAPGEADEVDLFAWLRDETIGPLRDGMSADEVVKLLGQPSEKEEIWEEGATGDWVQMWRFAGTGISLNMAAATETGPQRVSQIWIEAPCAYATKRGIKLGSTRAQLQKAYGDVKDLDFVVDEGDGGEGVAEEEDASEFVAGSLFGGIIFDLEADEVTKIFMGAAAE